MNQCGIAFLTLFLSYNNKSLLIFLPHLNIRNNLWPKVSTSVDKSAVVQSDGQLGINDLRSRDATIGLELGSA